MNKWMQQMGAMALALGFWSAAANASEPVVPCVDASAGSNAAAAADGQQRWRYPFEARKQRAEGTVKLRVQLAADGTATQVRLAASSGSSVLDRAALKAARNERFCKLAAPDETMPGVAEVSVHYALNVAIAKL